MKKTLRIIACVALIAVIGVGAFCAASFAGKDNTPNDKADAGLIITPGEVQGDMISLLAGPTSSSTAGSFGFVREYTLTVVLNADCPEDQKAIDWSIAWKNPSSTWATGKVVTDYVTVTPTSDGALTATVKNIIKSGIPAELMSFNEQIIVTAASRVRPELKATATVDCLKSNIANTSGNNLNVTAKNVVLKIGQPIAFDVEVDDSAIPGTIGFTRAEANCVSASSNSSITAIIKKYSLESAVSQNLLSIEKGAVLSMDNFLKCKDEATKSTVAYKQAYNEVLEYLKNNDIVVYLLPKLYYNDIVYYNPSSYIMQGLNSQNVRIDVSALTPFDLVTNVAFADNAIIF